MAKNDTLFPPCRQRDVPKVVATNELCRSFGYNGGSGRWAGWRFARMALASMVGAIVFASAVAHAADAKSFRLGSGSVGGAYHAFADDLIEVIGSQGEDEFRLVNVATEGSVDNLQRIKEGSLDLAIVQNDIAYYVYQGRHGHEVFRGFSAGIPFFPEYVQVLVRRDSPLHILGDLRNRVVCLGPKRSGSYRNALDLMGEIGLRSGVDFEARNDRLDEAVGHLLSGEIDALIHTGAFLPGSGDAGEHAFRVLPISREIGNALATRSPYYTVTEIGPRLTGEQAGVPTVAVSAYLVVGNHVAAGDAEAIVRAVSRARPGLQAKEKGYELLPLEEGVRRTPVPFHPGVQRFLQSEGHLDSHRGEYAIAAFGVLLLAIVYWAHRTCSGYDRMGNIRAVQSARYYRVLLAISRSGTFMVITAGFLLLATGLMATIRHYETAYARAMNIENAFVNVDFGDAMLWMFMFMGSGDPGEMFPLSTQGRVLATILPFVGLTTLLGFFFIGVEQRRAASADRKRGTLIKNVRGHVLLCGWNEKAPGIIYALTSREVPVKKQVVVVAEIDGDMPLEQYKFDPRYVSYCRGDSADHDTLERARAKDAASAIVVAGVRKQAGRNVRSVLSVLALKELARNASGNGASQGDLFVAAEMVYGENESFFEVSNADAIVHADTIVDRMVVQCCINEYVVDFFMDILSYDDYSELYSVELRELREMSKGRVLVTHLGRGGWRTPGRAVRAVLPRGGSDSGGELAGLTLGAVRSALAPYGVHVVGATQGDGRKRGARRGVVDHTFSKGDCPYRMPIDREGRDYRLGAEDALVYFADDRNDIHLAQWRMRDRDGRQDSASVKGAAAFPLPHDIRVILAGDYSRCRAIAERLGCVPWVKVHILTEIAPAGDEAAPEVTVGALSRKASWEEAGLAASDVVALVTKPPGVCSTGDGGSDHGEVDARTIFAMEFVRRFSRELGGDPDRKGLRVVAEMLGRNNRSLFVDAGVDVVVPSGLLAERVLTKMVYNYGRVSDFIMALLAVEDDIHLQTVRLDEIHHGALLGKRFYDVSDRLPEGWQLLGLLPSGKQQRERLRNSLSDFTYHFIVSPTSKEDLDYRTSPGDCLFLVVDRKEWLRQVET